MRSLLCVTLILICIATTFSQTDVRSADPVYQALKVELEAIYDDDQKFRQKLKFGSGEPPSKEMMELLHKIEEADAKNLSRVTAILDKYGWIGPDQIGAKANSALFLVIQHADIQIQEKYLPVLRIAVKENKAKPSSLAMLEDRVRLRRGQKQIYGTQLTVNQKTHKSELGPLEDPANVDKRRKEVGLGPLAEYLKEFGIEWKPN